MRALILFLLLPFLAVADSPDEIDVSYSIKGETVTMTWSGAPEVAKYILKSGHEVEATGSISYSMLEEFETGSQFQWTYHDKAKKPESLVYYKIVGLNTNNEIVTEAVFTANFLNKDYYTVNLSPNYFSKELEMEINTKTTGAAHITVEDLTGNFRTNEARNLDAGYNALSIDVKDANTTRLVVKIDHNEKIVYRLVEMEGSSPPVFTSDE